MTPDAAERRARALLDGATPGPWDAGAVNVYATARCPRHCVGGCPTASVPCACVIVATSASDRDRLLIAAAPDLARDVLALADALRTERAAREAAERERDAAEMQRDDAAHAAEHWRESHDIERARADAADARCAALAGAVLAAREAERVWSEAGDAMALGLRAAVKAKGAASSRALAALRERVASTGEAHDAARKHLDALLRGAPGGYVAVRVVREYLRARDAHAMPRPEATTAALRDDVIAARTALDAALLAATTTPKEST